MTEQRSLNLMTWGLQHIPSLHHSQDPSERTTHSDSLIWIPSQYMGNRCIRGQTFPTYRHQISQIHICVIGLTVPKYGHFQTIYSTYLLLMPLYGHIHAVYIFSFDIFIYRYITSIWSPIAVSAKLYLALYCLLDINRYLHTVYGHKRYTVRQMVNKSLMTLGFTGWGVHSLSTPFPSGHGCSAALLPVYSI